MLSLLPPSTNADYQGASISPLFLLLTAIMTLVPGLIHSFLPDGGAGVIAHLDMGNRRDLVIAVFRWEGSTQLALGLGLLAIALRYQTLTALGLALVIVERGLVTLHAWVLGPAGGHHPPEHFASPVSVILCLIFLTLSLRKPRA
ncbi:MAG: hypothetical protein CFE28_07760 [Alphaproteobacteria bacterium PA2]|nr:MAG: hypothetical protein CFE28_07760 [Alphaproteobacteria bacterium PA2]